MTFTCDENTNDIGVTYKWKFNGNDRFPTEITKVLEIDAVNETHSGSYACETTAEIDDDGNTSTETSDSIIITIKCK